MSKVISRQYSVISQGQPLLTTDYCLLVTKPEADSC